MLASAGFFTAMTAALKHLALAGYSESQMIFVRCGAGLVLMIPLMQRGGAALWRVARPWPVLGRSLTSTAGFFLAFYAFANLPLAQAQAISFSRTLFIAVLAVWILKEQVYWRRWLAIFIGFVGVVVMVRPEAGGLGDPAALAAIGSAALFAVTVVTVKDLTRDHTTLQLVFFTNATTALAGLPFALVAWQTPGLWDGLVFLILAIAGVGAQSCFVRALSLGEASLMGLMDYVRLPLAAAAGFVLFAERPDLATILGAVVVIGSTLYITWREGQVGAKRAASEAGPG